MRCMHLKDLRALRTQYKLLEDDCLATKSAMLFEFMTARHDREVRQVIDSLKRQERELIEVSRRVLRVRAEVLEKALESFEKLEVFAGRG